MKKIKIINNGFELDYLDDEVAEYSRERKMVNKIINLIDDYTCFVTTRCDDKILSELKIVNYLKTGKYSKTLELEEFPEIKETLFEGIYFYFMPKGFEFNLFTSGKVYGNKLYKKYGAKLCLELNEFGTVYITYNSMYDEQIRNILGEENIKQPFFKRKKKNKSF